MASRAAAILRQTGPHRVAAGLIVGMALAWRAGHPSVPIRPGAFGDGAANAWAGCAVALLVIAATFAFRLHRAADPASPRALRVVLLVAGASAAAGAFSLFVVAGSGWGAALAVVLAAIEVAAHVLRWDPVRTVPFEAFAVVGEGALAPLAGYAALAGDPGLAALLVLTVPNALALALAATLAEPAGIESPRRSLRAVLPGLLHAALALAAATGAVAVVIAGMGISLRPELALLAVPVAAMAVVFGWLALLDPRPERRERRAGQLVTVAGLALALGVAVVLSFA